MKDKHQLHAKYTDELSRLENIKKHLNNTVSLHKIHKESKGFDDKEFMKCIEESCESCQTYRKYNSFSRTSSFDDANI